ncbi:SDR family NAD(P)-dependent oxidoreductase [Jeotgalicoccus psychrophilus]|uniref:SDR family NAD(P)-dependent oxidoreductase n=1 Tax=Jeotgalicoccus psychrophilus TaxID=157228 RepID=UPI0004253ED8|nr:SDR family NAD(P)-dependent oxidoreductase [Jeotgalicoccus psychrophilus]
MSENILAITGPTSGIGRATAMSLAEQFDRIVLLVRNLHKGEALKNDIEKKSAVHVDLIQCDLSDLSSIKKAANMMNEQYDSINHLVLNAGVVSLTRQETKDGFEMMMGTNYIGHFYLTHLLLPLVLNSEVKQIVVVSSNGYKFSPLTAPYFKRDKFNPVTSYGQSKLGTLYLMQALYDGYHKQGLKTTAVHPGAVSTNLGKTPKNERFGNLVYKALDPFFLSPDEGSLSTVLAVESPKKYNGKYMHNGGVLRIKKHGSDMEARTSLITATLDVLNLTHL